MTIIKCKMCGGDLHITEGATVAECEYCGTRQTIPNQDDEKKLTLFARADRLRRACEFDKAAGVYESIVTDFPEEAEAYWGLVLCRYGIEYVDDPVTGKKVPTCHRSSFDSVLEDGDFEQATENADAVARKVYREEAKAIENIRRGILEVSGKEEPYDIFICYKETDENGDRTTDSTIAQDVYDILTEKGYRVFFSRISLEDKLGTEYEPYIFAALNSAKIMLVFGTDFEYFNAVWVKNEWSRFLKLMAQDKSKHLIPCYKGVDAYDMPKEFAKLQAQDMGKVGATQDLLRGIEKLLGKGAASAAASSAPAPIMQAAAPGVESLLKRGYMALEDGEWQKADEFFEQVLNLDAECAEAYWGKVLAENQCSNADEFKALRMDVTPTEEELCPWKAEQSKRVEEARNKYTVPSYLDTDDFWKLFNFSQYVRSTVKSQKELSLEEETYWQTDKLLTRAQRFAKGDFAESLNGLRESVLGQFQKDLATAEEKENVDTKAVMAAFSSAMEEAEKAVSAQYEKAVAKKESDKRARAEAMAEAGRQRKAYEEKKKKKKRFIFSIVALIVVISCILGVNAFKAQAEARAAEQAREVQIAENLAGNTYTYNNTTAYSSGYNYDRFRLTIHFLNSSECYVSGRIDATFSLTSGKQLPIAENGTYEVDVSDSGIKIHITGGPLSGYRFEKFTLICDIKVDENDIPIELAGGYAPE